MRITFLLTQGLDGSGGGGRYLPLAQALVRMGHQVRMIALHSDYSRAAQRRMTVGEVEVWYVGQMHVRTRGGQRAYFNTPTVLWVTAISTLRLTWAALNAPTDVIHVCKTQPMNGLAAWVAHKLRGTPVYLDNDDYEALNNRFAHAWQQKLVARLEDWMPAFAEGITVSTSFMSEHFRSLGYPANRMRLVPHGVDLNRFAVLESPELPAVLSRLRESLAISTNDYVVIYVGSLSLVNHAVDLLLDAFAEVISAEPRALLLLVGGGEDLINLKTLAERLKLTERVRFTGRVDREQIPFYYRLGRISVDPKQNTVRAHSSLSIKLVESIAAGIPCIAADTGDSRRILGEAGIAVTPGDAHALAEGILFVLNHPEAASRMREAAAQLRQAYAWDMLARAFAQIYKQLGEGA